MVIGTVTRELTDDMTLVISAENSSEAHQKAYDVLKEYPKVDPNSGCDFAYIDNRTNGKSSVIDIKIEKEIDPE